MNEFTEFPKMARLSREMIVTEKIDGTNGQIFITDEGEMLIGSRSRWITKETDNHGFHRWCMEHKDELMALGPGKHFGEWWGQGIQRGYGLKEKRFSLFNVSRWVEKWSRTLTVNPLADKQEYAPTCCNVIPVLFRGPFDTTLANIALDDLKNNGSSAAPGFMHPEGIVVWHVAGNFGLKKTIEKDETPKSKQ